MRLIDAEFALNLAEDPDYGFESWNGNMQDVEGLLNDCPTIEAKPVVHAHVIEHQGYEDEYYCECSNCHTHEVWVECKYCSECGAQMDELVRNTDELNSSVKIPVISMEDVPKIMEKTQNE